MLLRSEGVDLAASVRKLATGYLLVDFKRNVVDHLTRLATCLVSIVDKIPGAECLDRE